MPKSSSAAPSEAYSQPVTIESGTAKVAILGRPSARALADSDGYAEVAVCVVGDGEVVRMRGDAAYLRTALLRALDALREAEHDRLGNRRGHGAA